MASMTVRGLDDDVKRRFVEKARAAGQSAEAYLRGVIAREATTETGEGNDAAEGEASNWLDEIQVLAAGISDTSRREMEEGMASFRGDRTP